MVLFTGDQDFKSIDRSFYLTKKNSLIMFHHREIIYEKIDMVLQMI